MLRQAYDERNVILSKVARELQEVEAVIKALGGEPLVELSVGEQFAIEITEAKAAEAVEKPEPPAEPPSAGREPPPGRRLVTDEVPTPRADKPGHLLRAENRHPDYVAINQKGTVQPDRTQLMKALQAHDAKQTNNKPISTRVLLKSMSSMFKPNFDAFGETLANAINTGLIEQLNQWDDTGSLYVKITEKGRAWTPRGEPPREVPKKGPPLIQQPGPEAMPAHLRKLPIASVNIALGARIKTGEFQRQVLEVAAENSPILGAQLATLIAGDNLSARSRVDKHVRDLKEHGHLRETGRKDWTPKQYELKAQGKQIGRQSIEIEVTEKGLDALTTPDEEGERTGVPTS